MYLELFSSNSEKQLSTIAPTFIGFMRKNQLSSMIITSKWGVFFGMKAIQFTRSKFSVLNIQSVNWDKIGLWHLRTMIS